MSGAPLREAYDSSSEVEREVLSASVAGAMSQVEVLEFGRPSATFNPGKDVIALNILAIRWKRLSAQSTYATGFLPKRLCGMHPFVRWELVSDLLGDLEARGRNHRSHDVTVVGPHQQ